MKTVQLHNGTLTGEVRVPGDKSISHRSVMLGALAKGTTTISNFLTGADCLSTIEAFRALGVDIAVEGQDVTIESGGFHELVEPKHPIDLGNSGTTTRLLLGILAGLPHHVVLYGDASLTKRPMNRVTVPLREMGARIDGRDHGDKLPLSIRGGQLTPMTYTLPVNSAQVKSSILLAGLFTKGTTTVVEPVPTRDHTERMLKAFGVEVNREGNDISVVGNQEMSGTKLEVPGDISSAAFFLVGAAMTDGSDLTIRDVGLNPTRTGIVDVLERMGASINVTTTRYIGDEAIGDIQIKGSRLKAVTIGGDDIPALIDELPIIALLASQAEGETVIKDAEELRWKETDRIEAVVQTLSKMGVHIKGTSDGMVINGSEEPLKGGTFETYHDHRMGMMIAMASLLTEDPVHIQNPEVIDVSFPTFFNDLESLTN
ncbi:3-phosphoshikimate 1-carboxyvinyltransferase [Pontibacillus halophilus JSM 076056 = DSM 19796]|uniref:3-phosphoshikimate 1-carboxyvinyltransferase n=1 Tax=Pontibacillus halophilus JSM 076056 = DSM 19796 TaxID=1385510 RepID=A0A0A5GFX9_9BACI|nr:3-phosphoshikimate 1-carboxyvinyltransferase [Pontibacillus halophilus]KGX92156.1 3-phosphoshikimate 1-carboxyvinyltransferase [Pontibacillus halophilus JSM 076056 = DSM 19796]